ncbi:siphovirus Gp157 family protein [Rhizobium leguminosarum]
MAEVEFNLARQAEAAKRLMSNLRSQGVDDDQKLVSDTIEGETSLIEAIEAAIAEIDECDIHVIGLKAKEAELAERRRRLEERADRIKATIEQAMITTEQESLRLPTATLTLAKRAPGLIVTNEADIPTRFWIEQERPAPKLDRKALTAALRAKEPVPGAGLDNGTISLSVRRK